MKVSVAITTKNEERYIKTTLNSLINQTRKPDEIIIIAAFSIDRTYKIVKEYVKNNPERIKFKIDQKESIIPVGRDIGAKIAEGDILLIMDADISLKKDWLKIVLPYFQHSNIVAVCGDLLPSKGDIKSKLVYLGLTIGTTLLRFFDREIVSKGGTVFAVKKDIFKEIDGYLTDFVVSEDVYISRRLIVKGKIKFVKEAKGWFFVRRFEKMGYLKTCLKQIKIYWVYDVFHTIPKVEYNSVE